MQFHPDQQVLIGFLKKKGTGATMSKSLTAGELTQLVDLFASPHCELATKATLLTAFLMLKNTPDEIAWLTTVKAQHLVPAEIHWLLLSQPKTPFQSLALRVVKQEVLDKLYFKSGVTALFDPDIPEEEKAVFLEAARLKRETLEENLACLEVFWANTQRIQTEFPVIVDLANPYDGFNRNLFLAPFVAVLLASIGIPAVLHGLDEVSPKRGVNPFKIFKSAGKNSLKSLNEAFNQLKDVGWTYVDQSVFYPELYALKDLRIRMVKRPIIATIEKWLQPLRANGGNCVVTGYTHPEYSKMTVDVLNASGTCAQGFLVRGVEGSSQLGMDRKSPFVSWNSSSKQDGFVRPSEFGFLETARVEPNYELNAEDSLRAGLSALRGENETVLNSLFYQVVSIASAFALLSPPETISKLKVAVASGEALKRWDQFI